MREADVSYRGTENHTELAAGGRLIPEGIGWKKRELATEVLKHLFVGGDYPLSKARLTPSVENRMDAGVFSCGVRLGKDRFEVRIGVNSAKAVGEWRRLQSLSCVSGARLGITAGISTQEAAEGQSSSRKASGSSDEGEWHAPARSTKNVRAKVLKRATLVRKPEYKKEITED